MDHVSDNHSRLLSASCGPDSVLSASGGMFVESLQQTCLAGQQKRERGLRQTERLSDRSHSRRAARAGLQVRSDPGACGRTLCARLLSWAPDTLICAFPSSRWGSSLSLSESSRQQALTTLIAFLNDFQQRDREKERFLSRTMSLVQNRKDAST